MKLMRMTILMMAVALGAAVMTGCSPSATTRSTGETVDDSVISTRVKTALYQDEAVKGTDVEVQTYRGVVQLSGFVDTAEQASRAVEITEKVPGVVSVKNDMRVKPPEASQGQAQPPQQSQTQ